MKKLTYLLSLLLTIQTIFAEATISLDNLKSEHQLGDLIEIDISISSNEVFNNIHFDLEYDDDILEWIEFRESSISISANCELKFAKGEDKDDNREKLIFSLNWNENINLYEKTNILTVVFRVKDSSLKSNINFKNHIIQNLSDNDVISNWPVEVQFSVSNNSDEYIMIKSPYDGSVVPKENVLISLLFSKSEDYSVQLKNETNGYTSAIIESPLGYLEDLEVILSDGKNRVTAFLLDKNNSVLALNTSTIHYRNLDNVLRILNPEQSSVVNQNRILVKVASDFESISINKETATPLGYLDEEQPVYSRDVWLRPGFNTILVEARSSEDELFKKELTVYFEKSDEIFRFLKPLNNEIVKYEENLFLNFTGEVSQKFSTSGAENIITYNAVFYPRGYGQRSIEVITGGMTKIVESSSGGELTESAYVFNNINPILLNGHKSGTLEITAFKNKVGTTFEESTTIFAIVDDSKLEILIDQPRVYVDEYLSNEKIIKNFHKLATGDDTVTVDLFHNITLEPTGEFYLSETNDNVKAIKPWTTERAGLLELSDGTMLYYANKNKIARFRSKKIGAEDSEEWDIFYQDTDKFYVYDMVETEKGLLLGVSNYNADGNTGLYLLNDNILTNIVIGKPITHVQFVRKIDDTIFLYGNNYSHIYSFNINTLEPQNGKLITSVVNSYPLNNSVAIEDFKLSPSLNSAAILTGNGDVSFYSIDNGSYTKHIFISEADDKELFSNVKNIHMGDYTKGAYYSWLIEKEDTLLTVMERKSDGELKEYSVSLGLPEESTVLAASYKNDNFYLLYKDQSNYGNIRSGQFFFNKFVEDDNRIFSKQTITDSESNLTVTDYNGIFWGNGVNTNLYNFTSDIYDNGKAEFSYSNPDIEGIRGFSFNIPGKWYNSNDLTFDYKFRINSGESFSSAGFDDNEAKLSIKDWIIIYKETEYWSSFVSYNSKRKEYQVDVYFNKLQIAGSMDFKFNFLSSGMASPSVSSLNIKKKVHVRIPTIDNSSVTFPIKGRVTDPTVNFIWIGSKKLLLDGNGFFKTDYLINTSTEEEEITLNCFNSAGESVTESILVQLFKSVNGLQNSSIYDDEDLSTKLIFDDDGEVLVMEDTIFISTDFYGLKGAIVGYEILSLTNDVLIKQGIFETEIDDVFNSEIYPDENNNLESGKVILQPVLLNPGSQKFRLFVENPGGKRSSFYINDNEEILPIIIYDMPQENEKIKITSTGVEDITSYEIYADCDVLQQFSVSIPETETSPYEFKKRIKLTGRVESLQSLSSVKIRSSSEDITFINDMQEIDIEVDEINSFSFDINIKMKEGSPINEEHFIVIEPLAAYLIGLKSVMKLSVTKDFAGAHIIPDFSSMEDNDLTNKANKWTNDERNSKSKILKLKFDRKLPVGARLNLKVNFENQIDGLLSYIPNSTGEYNLVGDNEELLKLDGVKFGVNRVRWDLYYGLESDIISSSLMNDPDMRDFILNLEGSSTFIDTVINFAYEAGAYYKTDNLPVMNYIKDPSTTLEVYLNDKIYRTVTTKDSPNGTITFTSTDLLEGKNEIFINKERNYTLLYDSKVPRIGEKVVTIDEFNNIKTLSTIVHEANIRSVMLYEKKFPNGLGVSSSEPVNQINIEPEITPLSNNYHKVEWVFTEDEVFILDPPLNPHNSLKPLNIEVIDYSNKGSVEEYFYGPIVIDRDYAGDARALIPNGIIGSNDHYYNNTPRTDYRHQYSDSIGRWVFNDDSPVITSDQFININTLTENLNEEFRIERPGSIHFEGLSFKNGTTGPIVINSGLNSGISFANGFKYPIGRTLTANVGSVGRFSPNPGVVFDKKNFELSVYFRIEIEESPAFSSENEGYKKIITLGSSEGKDFYLGYIRNSNKKDIDLILNIGDEVIPIVTTLPLSPKEYGFLVRINNYEDIKDFQLIIDDYSTPLINLESYNTPANFLSEGTRFYLGEKSKRDNGNFSINRLFYVNKLISSSDVASYYDSADLKDNFGEVTGIVSANTSYDFSLDEFDKPNDTGDKPYKLRIEKGHFSKLEDVDYNTDGSSLIGSSYHRNFLEKRDDYIIFNDCDIPITANNLEYSLDNDYLSLKVSNGTKGRYTFGNKPTNHSVKNNKFYAISGTISRNNIPDVGKDVKAELVLLFNNKEKRFQLKEGDFQFIFENPNNEVPKSIVMFIETAENIKIGNNIQFVEGNSTFGDDIFFNDTSVVSTDYNSYVSTNYIYSNSGTVDLYYKPFNTNIFGHVDYDAYIYSSDLIDIYTEDNVGKICYVAEIDNSIKLKTNIPVMDGWHNLVVTYSQSYGQARFYIDGEVAAFSEKFIFPGMRERSDDNIIIGGNPPIQKYAEGYIDNVKLSGFFTPPETPDRGTPIKLVYDTKDDVKLLINNNRQDAETDWSVNVYSILSKNTTSAPVIAHFKNESEFNLNSDVVPGLYFARLSGILNGKRVSSQVQFVRDDKPSFNLIKIPKLIIPDVTTVLNFDLIFDNTYLPEEKNGRYPGLALGIKGKDNDIEREEIIYLSQNFIEQKPDLWQYKYKGDEKWTPIEKVNNIFKLAFEDQQWSKDLYYGVKSFYFKDNFIEDDIDPFEVDEKNNIIPFASLEEINIETESFIKANGELVDYEYMLDISLAGANKKDKIQNINNFKVKYTVGYKNNQGDIVYSNNQGVMDFSEYGFLSMYYDDILSDLGYGSYEINLELIYKGSSFQSKKVNIEWNQVVPGTITMKAKNVLKINSLELLTTESKDGKNSGDFYFSYQVSHDAGMDVSVFYEVTVTDVSDNSIISSIGKTKITDKFIVLNDIELGSVLTSVEVKLYEEITEDGNIRIGITDKAYTTVNISSEAPEIILTNKVSSYVSYDSMTFTWKGLVGGENHDDIKYSYNFDSQGWNTPSKQWKDLELYSLNEGFHELKVKAIYNGQESSEALARFFVDVKYPSINESKLEFEKVYTDDGIAKEVIFRGKIGAITDVSLDYFTINGEEISVNAAGEFISEPFKLYMEGKNYFTFGAIDMVGNITTREIVVENNFIEILSPRGSLVKYSPLTLVGRLNENITQDVEVYLQDSVHRDVWHKGRVNSDRVFFIDDIGINPGNEFRKAKTDLRLRLDFGSGAVFDKDIKIEAGVLYRPLTITLSKQATQGAGEPIELIIDAECNIDNIASWSVDFDGDGIYDDIFVTDNSNENVKSWTHSYSTIGEVIPRVRVITRNGEYFSQTASLIIHEQVKSASSTTVLKPIGMSIAHLQDKSEKVFVLNGDPSSAKVDLFAIGRNLNYFSNKQYSIELKTLITGEATNIIALSENAFTVTTEAYINGNYAGIIYLFNMNEFGNYVVVGEKQIDGYVSSMALSDNYLFVTRKNSSKVNRYNRTLDNIDFETLNEFDLKLPLGDNLLPEGTPITFLNGILYAADKDNQRVIEYSENIVPLNYWGEYGHNDKEFLQPDILAGYGNRLFVSDKSKENIQIFDSGNRIVSTLNSNGDYLEGNFFNEITAIDSLGREEGARLFYYIVVLSKSTESISLIRLPQWEEMRASTRNNKIVFLKDREVYTAKPNGSDLMKVLSTDSLPRIEGVVDYPTISPDGRRLAFVSRKKIYTGSNETVTDDTWAYDNLYILKIGNERPIKIPLSGIEGYEIERPVFNSNGDSIAFSARTEGGFWQIYEYNWDTGTVTILFDSIENLRFPYYSPDDRYLVYTTDYDGDQDLEIFDKENPDIRIEVTANNFRDSFPVWSRVYPFEISNLDLDIESKIAFVSDRGFKKGIHYAYISKPSEHDLRVVTITGEDVGDTPDMAATEVTKEYIEGDYPAYTGDGRHIVYEEYDGISQVITKWSHEDDSTEIMNLPQGSQKPSGMRNTITGFKAELQNGNEVRLSWIPYTDHKTFYLLQYKMMAEADYFTQKKIYSQNGTTVSGLEMNTGYLMRVIIEENEEKVAETRWLKVKVPEVVARASYEIDADNPYLVNFHAWKPEEETEWKFTWIIDNQEITTADTSQDLQYQFSTSGEKTIQLKATNSEGKAANISDSFTINIITDIKPIIHSTLITGAVKYLELDAENSLGNRINMSSALWTITGPGVSQAQTYTGSKVIVDVSEYMHKVNVNLKLSRYMVYGQQETDTLEINTPIDLDYIEVKPIVTYETHIENQRLLTFDGTRSLGNIDWRNARWQLYSDGDLIQSENGVSSFSYLFPETSRFVPYAVALTVNDTATGLSKTTSQTISVDRAEIEPVVDYEILTLKEGDEEVGVKVILSATGSKGSNIDFNLTEWNLPLAAQLGEQPKQKGPTAIFNLRNPGGRSQVEVSITLMRRGGTDVVTKTILVNIDGTGVSKTEIFVNKEIMETSEGNVIILDVLGSKGADIDWQRTEWLVNGQYSYKGPVARIDMEYIGESRDFIYAVILYRFGTDPIYYTGVVPIESYKFLPNITLETDFGNENTKSLTVKYTEGLNIDWSRTLWSIYDGNEDVVQKRGASIMHTFVPKENAMGYPVMVEMYLKNDDRPFYGYKSIQIEGDEIVPVIQWDEDISNYSEEDADKQVISFTALSSTGAGIDWSKTKWNFGDGSSPGYGSSVQHKYPIDGADKAYKVALTLTRTSRTGSNESKTVYKNIDIDAEEIKPVIKAKLDRASNTLILSAENSEGRGLLLDRTIWMFAGKGDTENFSRSKTSVETTNNSLSLSENISRTDSLNSSNTDSTNSSYTTSQNTSHTDSENSSHTDSENNSHTDSENDSHTDSENDSHTESENENSTESTNNSTSENEGSSTNSGWNVNTSVSQPLPSGTEIGLSGGYSEGESDSEGSSETEGGGTSDSSGSGSSDSSGSGSSDSSGTGSSDSSGTGSSDSSGTGSSDTSGNGSSDSSGTGSSDTTGSGSSDTNGSGTSQSNSSGTSDTRNNNQSFSTQNTHTGAVCRRYVDDFNFDDYGAGDINNRKIWVTLFVYRLNSDGSMSGTSFTERINIEEVKKAGNTGKEYR